MAGAGAGLGSGEAGARGDVDVVLLNMSSVATMHLPQQCMERVVTLEATPITAHVFPDVGPCSPIESWQGLSQNFELP